MLTAKKGILSLMLFAKKRVYADAAAATPLSTRVKRELMRLLEIYGNPGGLHAEGIVAKNELEKAREIIATAIGAHADEIVFAASGTEANNLAIQGLLHPLLLAYGEVNAVTCAIEHPSVLVPLHALEREGLYMTELPVDSDGFVSVKALRDAINEQTVLVSIQLVNSEIGTIQSIRELVKELRRARKERGSGEGILPIYFHTDAAQAPLWLALTVEKLGIDLMTLDAQKILGPKGVGALYIRRGVEIEPMIWGGKQERGMRGGTENLPLVGAFAVALADAQNAVEARTEKVAKVRDYLIAEIKKLIPDVIVHGHQQTSENAIKEKSSLAGQGGHRTFRGEGSLKSVDITDRRVANNISISVPWLDGEMAVIAMNAEGIAISTRSACSTSDDEPSATITAIGVPKELAKTVVRITLLPSATLSEANRIAKTLASVAKRYRTVA